MKERPLICSAREVRGLLNGSVSLIVRPVVGAPKHNLLRPHNKLTDVWAWRYMRARNNDVEFCCPLGAPGDRLWVRETWWANRHSPVGYRADGEMPAHMAGTWWKPAATMPRRASRLSLDVVSVKVVRLWSITDAQALRAGATQAEADKAGVEPRDEFSRIWEARWGKRYPWENNPWVWCAGVRRASA